MTDMIALQKQEAGGFCRILSFRDVECLQCRQRVQLATPYSVASWRNHAYSQDGCWDSEKEREWRETLRKTM